MQMLRFRTAAVVETSTGFLFLVVGYNPKMISETRFEKLKNLTMKSLINSPTVVIISSGCSGRVCLSACYD